MRLPLPRSWLLAATGMAVLSVAGLSLIGCSSSGNSTAESAASLGKPLDEDVPKICTGCLSEEKIGQTVAVEGDIIQQCPAMGCWFRLKDDAGEAFVDLAPAKLRLEENRVGQHAKVTGRVVKEGGKLRLQAQHVEFSAGKKDKRPDAK